MFTSFYTFLKRIWRGFVGYHFALQKERQPAMLVLCLVVYLAPIYFLWPLREIELLMIVLSIVLVQITELHNTAMETALDRLHPEMHNEIGASKDIAASATVTAALFAVGVLVWILVSHLS